MDARVDPGAYLYLAIRQLGGVVSELLFDAEDFRLGSSVDEIIVAAGAARTLESVGAFRNAEEGMARMIQVVHKMLIANTAIVQSIAARLEQHRHIEGQALADVLRGVRAC